MLYDPGKLNGILKMRDSKVKRYTEIANSLLVLENKYYSAVQCGNCDIPGYIILKTKKQIKKIHDMPKEALALLGVVLSKLEHAIELILKPDKIYIVKFGEESDALHFHVFPRTKYLTEKYLMEFPNRDKKLNGPVFLDWAREKYKVEFRKLSRETTKTIELIKSELIKT